MGRSPFSHLSHPNHNPKSNPNLTLTLILTLTNPNLNSNHTLTLTLTLRRVTKVRKWTRAQKCNNNKNV